MLRVRKLFISLLFGFFMFSLAPALPGAHLVAQPGSTRGLMAGLQYTGASFDVRSAAEDLRFGSGFGLHVGFGMGDDIAVLANFDRAVLRRRSDSDAVTVSQYDALLRAYLTPGPDSPVRLFAVAGATGRAASGTTEFKGLAPTGGAGAHIGIAPAVALTGSVLWTFGNLVRLRDLTGGDVTRETFKSTGVRVQAGMTVFLFRE